MNKKQILLLLALGFGQVGAVDMEGHELVDATINNDLIESNSILDGTSAYPEKPPYMGNMFELLRAGYHVPPVPEPIPKLIPEPIIMSIEEGIWWAANIKDILYGPKVICGIHPLSWPAVLYLNENNYLQQAGTFIRQETGHRYYCNLCPAKYFMKYETVLQHVFNDHFKTRYHCPVQNCTETVSSLLVLRNHIKNKHFQMLG